MIVLVKSIILNKNPLHGKFCENCERCSSGYTGSGVLLYKDVKKKFILGIDYKNELTDFGGKIDFVNENICNTASRELFEESNRVLNISSKDILSCQYIDIDRYTHKYRCYILPIKKFDKKLFDYNKQNIKNSSSVYKEITNIIEIDQESLKNKLLYKLNTVEIIPYDISPRLKKILYIYFEST